MLNLQGLKRDRKMKLYEFQGMVNDWMKKCFDFIDPEIKNNLIERNYRFLEESLELVQSTGLDRNKAHELVDYVFDRPAGQIEQEIGGVLVTLAALSTANDISMHQSAISELQRIDSMIDIIRVKHQNKVIREK